MEVLNLLYEHWILTIVFVSLIPIIGNLLGAILFLSISGIVYGVSSLFSLFKFKTKGDI